MNCGLRHFGNSWRISSVIKDGLSLFYSSWTSVLPSENSRHHFVTVCRLKSYHKQQQFVCKFPLDVRSPFGLRIVWRDAHRIWRDFGSAQPFQTRLTQTKPVLPLSNEHGSRVKDQGRRQCCHNKHKNFPIGLHVMYLYFPGTPHIMASSSALPLSAGR